MFLCHLHIFFGKVSIKVFGPFNYNKCNTLVRMLITGETMHKWGQGVEICVPSAQFCYEPKTALKKIKLKKKNRGGNCLMGTAFLFGKMKTFWRWTMVMAAQQGE